MNLIQTALALLMTLAVLPATVVGAELKALVGGRLIDGYGGEPLENSVILVEGERIQAVGREGEVEIPQGAEVISTEGMSVLPGLWDAHVHLMIIGHGAFEHWRKPYSMPAAVKQLLLAGVTSARDMAAPLEDILNVREAIRRGEIPGPTLYVCGPFIRHESPPPGYESLLWGVQGAKDARAKVRRLAKAGVDFIKLIDQDRMSMEEVRAVVDEARQHSLPVVAHAQRVEEFRRGLEVGVDEFTHLGLGPLGMAPEFPAEIFEMMQRRANTLMFWTPTITLHSLWEDTRANPERIDDPRWHEGLSESVVQDIRASLRHFERLDYFHRGDGMPPPRAALTRKFAQLRESGVIMLIGTDSGGPLNFHSDSTWRELDYWVRRFGVSPMDAIRAATYWPAVRMNVADKVGTIAEGKYADIIAVRGDVLQHIDLLQDVDLVIKRGKRYK